MDKGFSVWRKRMFYRSAAVFFIDKTRKIQAPRMLADGLFIRVDCPRNVSEGYFRPSCQKQQNLDSVMIRHSLQMPLHLFCRFKFNHDA